MQVLFGFLPFPEPRMQDAPQIEEFDAIDRVGILRSIVNRKRAVQHSPGVIQPPLFQVQRTQTMKGCGCVRRLASAGGAESVKSVSWVY